MKFRFPTIVLFLTVLSFCSLRDSEATKRVSSLRKKKALHIVTSHRQQKSVKKNYLLPEVFFSEEATETDAPLIPVRNERTPRIAFDFELLRRTIFGSGFSAQEECDRRVAEFKNFILLGGPDIYQSTPEKECQKAAHAALLDPTAWRPSYDPRTFSVLCTYLPNGKDRFGWDVTIRTSGNCTNYVPAHR